MARVDVVVIGSSSGGIAALETLLRGLDGELDAAIVIVQHMSPNTGDSIEVLLRKYSKMKLKEPIDKEGILPGHVYIAPADYHLMIEREGYFAISMSPKRNFCRPSIDVLFETAAEAYPGRIMGVVLTGANCDGTNGCSYIKKYNGIVVVQDLNEAQTNIMPKCVIDAGLADYILSLEEISAMINRLCTNKRKGD